VNLARQVVCVLLTACVLATSFFLGETSLTAMRMKMRIMCVTRVCVNCSVMGKLVGAYATIENENEEEDEDEDEDEDKDKDAWL